MSLQISGEMQIHPLRFLFWVENLASEEFFLLVENSFYWSKQFWLIKNFRRLKPLIEILKFIICFFQAVEKNFLWKYFLAIVTVVCVSKYVYASMYT